MTYSIEQRRANVELALITMLDELGDNATDQTSYCASVLPDIYATTWSHLVDRGLLSARWITPENYYHLTPAGWLQALRVSGRFNAAQLSEQAGRVMARLKDCVKGRHDPDMVDVETIARAANVPAGWVINAVDSHLLLHLFKRKDADWELRPIVVLVPIDFGQELL